MSSWLKCVKINFGHPCCYFTFRVIVRDKIMKWNFLDFYNSYHIILQIQANFSWLIIIYKLIFEGFPDKVKICKNCACNCKDYLIRITQWLQRRLISYKILKWDLGICDIMAVFDSFKFSSSCQFQFDCAIFELLSNNIGIYDKII